MKKRRRGKRRRRRRGRRRNSGEERASPSTAYHITYTWALITVSALLAPPPPSLCPAHLLLAQCKHSLQHRQWHGVRRVGVA